LYGLGLAVILGAGLSLGLGVRRAAGIESAELERGMSRYVASNSAGLKVDIFHFLKTDGKDLILFAVALLVGGAVASVNWKVGLTIMGIGAFVPLSSVFSVPTIFREGDVCPAVVIDPDRQLVAIFTNLSKGGRPKPVVKVLKQPLRRAVKKPVKKGTRLAFIAMYNGFAGSPNWANFGGYLADVGTGSSKAIQRVLSSISETDWENVLTAVKGLKQPYREGLFDVQVGKRSGGEGSVRAVPHQMLRNSLKIAACVVGGLVLLSVLGGVLSGRMKMGRGAAAWANNDPPADRLFAGQGHPPAVNPGAGGWTPQTNPIVPMPPNNPGVVTPPVNPGFPPSVGPSRSVGTTQPTDASSAAGPTDSPFRPKAPQTDSSPFRPKTAETEASPFRLKSPQPETAKTDSATPVPAAGSGAGGGWRVGDKAEGLDHSIWRPVTILAVQGNDGWKVHWDGWPDTWDEVLPGNRLRPIQGK